MNSRILITGACGFVGAALCRLIRERWPAADVVGMDNLSRRGSWTNLDSLQSLGVDVRHGDIRCQSDIACLPDVDWVIDAAANPRVLAGLDGQSSSRQLVEQNLFGTVNLLEYCKSRKAGLILLSTSRVYSIESLQAVTLEVNASAFQPAGDQTFPAGISIAGVSESCTTVPSVSMYGATKIASEILALEYGQAFDFPVWINRCGVLAGAGQFAHPAQGIFSFWVHSFREGRPLRYIGFGGSGYQVRDCLNPRDLLDLIERQVASGSETGRPRVVNAAGGLKQSMSLRQLSDWCQDRLGGNRVESSTDERRFDLPWIVLDCELAREHWDWAPRVSLNETLEEIARHAEEHPHWLALSGR